MATGREAASSPSAGPGPSPGTAARSGSVGATRSAPRPLRSTEKHGAEWQRRRRRLLDTAADVFFRRGFQAGTTKEIAELAGMSQSTIYHYVDSKEQLMGDIARQVYSDFTESLDQALTSDRDPAAQLGRVIDAFISSLVLNQQTFAVYWKEFRAIPREIAREARAQERAFIHRVERIVAAAQADGTLPAHHATQLLSEGILGMMSWMHWWYRPEEHTPRQISAAFRDLIGLGRG
jgi:TetR/AcrR family transcriptional regulator, cholesterol catabolism regulator